VRPIALAPVAEKLRSPSLRLDHVEPDSPVGPRDEFGHDPCVADVNSSSSRETASVPDGGHVGDLDLRSRPGLRAYHAVLNVSPANPLRDTVSGAPVCGQFQHALADRSAAGHHALTSSKKCSGCDSADLGKMDANLVQMRLEPRSCASGAIARLQRIRRFPRARHRALPAD
jgi:hypothetical protein